jgi:hypothetical protein
VFGSAGRCDDYDYDFDLGTAPERSIPQSF